MAKREAMLGVCKRCKGSYDMDFEEGWSDHHTAPDGTECAPAPERCTWVTDRVGTYCSADHSEDWFVDVVEVDDDD